MRGARRVGAPTARALGIRLKVRPAQDATTGIFDADQRADIVVVGWLYDWPDPRNVLNGIFDPARPLGYGYPVSNQLYDNPGATRAVRGAYRVAGPGRAPAYRRADARILRGDSPPWWCSRTPSNRRSWAAVSAARRRCRRTSAW